MKQTRVLSAIQPSGELHLGNYFGAIANWRELQDAKETSCAFVVVDMHAMTVKYDPSALDNNTWQMAADLVACGIDPELSLVFIQSLVPEHTELFWILSCLTSFGELSRQVQFKEKSQSAADS